MEGREEEVPFTGRRRPLLSMLGHGSEFVAHSKINKRYPIDVFCAKPYTSLQRGTNENINGKLRRLWPKKMIWDSFSKRNRQWSPVVEKGLTQLEIFSGKRVALIAWIQLPRVRGRAHIA